MAKFTFSTLLTKEHNLVKRIRTCVLECTYIYTSVTVKKFKTYRKQFANITQRYTILRN